MNLEETDKVLIVLDEKWVITSDKHNFSVAQVKVVRSDSKGKKAPGTEYLGQAAHFGKIEDCLKYVLTQSLKQGTKKEIKDLIKSIDQAKEDIVTACLGFVEF